MALVSCATLALALAMGCATTYYVPDVAGVVVRAESLPGHATGHIYVLADGRRVTVDGNSTTLLLPLEPNVGDLALVGSVPEPWYGGRRPRTSTRDGCRRAGAQRPAGGCASTTKDARSP